MTATKRALLISVIIGMLLISISHPACNIEAKELKIKTWIMPQFMREYLQMMINSFNQSYEAKIKGFVADLRENHRGFKDMPEDVMFDAEIGHFVKKSDLKAYQEQKAQEINKVKKGLQPMIKKEGK